MTIDEIKAAIAAGKKVCWSNAGYVVSLFPSWIGKYSTGLKVTFFGNGHTVGLQFEELKDCFISE